METGERVALPEGAIGEVQRTRCSGRFQNPIHHNLFGSDPISRFVSKFQNFQNITLFYRHNSQACEHFEENLKSPMLDYLIDYYYCRIIILSGYGTTSFQIGVMGIRQFLCVFR